MWNIATEKYKAVKRDYVLTDGVKGDAVISAVKGASSYKWLATDQPLNDSDYYFDSLSITLKEFDAVCVGDVWSDPELHSAYSEYDDTEVWIRTEGESGFSLLKTLGGFNSATVALPEKTVGFMLKHSSEFCTTQIGVTTNLHLKPSSRVYSLVREHTGEECATLVKNKAKLIVTKTENNEPSDTVYDTGNNDGWLCSYELNIGTSSIYAAKDCSNDKNNIETNSYASTVTIPVMIAGWGYSNTPNSKKLIDEVTVEGEKRVRFKAKITSLSPGETMTITVPATVKADNSTIISNTSYITGYNGMSFTQENYIASDTTYHIVVDIKAKIKKVNSKGEGLAGAQLQILNKDNTVAVSAFTSTTDVMTFNLAPDDYILHEVSPPSDTYKTAADIPFTLDVEGICHVDGKAVNYVEMVDQPAFKVIFHQNKPNGTDDEKQKEFRVYEPTDLKENKVPHFYDIPEWAGDEYVFVGWYHGSYQSGSFKSYTNIDTDANAAFNFENVTFTTARSGDDPDYHIYAKWIKVGTVKQDDADKNQYDGTYRGFGIAGVQIRPKTVKVFNKETGQYVDATMYDDNERDKDAHGSEYSSSAKPTPEGMRFVASLSESLITSVNGISRISSDPNDEMNKFGIEYGYVVGTEENINTFVGNYQVKDPSAYSIKYNGKNVNGVDTRGFDDNNIRKPKEERNADNDYAYVTNVNCTSKQGTNNNSGVVLKDHRNFDNYRLYTLVVTYDDTDPASYKGEKIAARAYFRYYDANGKLRVFYNTYKKSMYSGCMCSFNQAYAAFYG